MAERVSERKHWDEFWDTAGHVDQVYSNEGRVERHLKRVVSPAGKRMLEVGAGTGRDGIELARQGAFVVSLDYSPSSLRMIRSQLAGGERVVLCCGDACALPFRDGVFDVVFHQGLLEHFRSPGTLVAENHRVLRSDGLVLVDVPQRYHYYSLVKHIMIALGRWFAGWETEYSIGQLEQLLRSHSFSIVRSYGEWLNPPIWFRMLRRALLPAGIHLPMYPALFTWVRNRSAGIRSAVLGTRFGIYTALVIGTIARKK
ncbi:MAG TPA: class I SAM-dependent methyltransferase [Patescibacteria group bacterium]|nr:class I SAM-dependent methyltransferase [Patescibacteria group bacterium]